MASVTQQPDKHRAIPLRSPPLVHMVGERVLRNLG